MVGAAGKECVAKQAILSVNNVIMAAAKNWRMAWGKKTAEEPVCGTDIPRVIHETFHGEVECETIYVTDDNWKALASLTDQAVTIVSTDKDTSSTPGQVVTTMSVKINRFERVGPGAGEGVVRARLTGTMLAVPT
jgi:hypothetical protein